jgi:hypothetical protein
MDGWAKETSKKRLALEAIEAQEEKLYHQGPLFCRHSSKTTIDNRASLIKGLSLLFHPKNVSDREELFALV